jgi:neuronal calcium sensor 1
MGNCNCGRSNKSSKFDSTILTEEEIRFLLSNTKLTREQINALHYNFLEECPSGKMTKKDFSKLFKKVHQSDNKKEKSDKFCDYVFKVIDAENRGYISFKDFVLCLSLTSYGDFKQKCEFAFRLYDLDKDGKISKKEMTLVLESLYDLSGIVDRKGNKAPAKKVEEIINKLNKNNTISSASSNNLVSSKNKTNDYITKDQFMDGCLNDKNIKNLFIDSIFAKATHDDEKNHNINNNKDLLIGETPKLCFLCIFKVTPLKAPEYTVSDMKKVTDTKLKSSSFNYVEKKPSLVRHEPNINVTEFRPNNGYDLVLKVSESEAYQLADKYSSLNRNSSIQTYEIDNKEPKFENLEHIQSQSIILDQVHNFTVNENIIHHLENQNNITDYQETYEGYYNIENIPKIEQNQYKNQADNIYLLLDEKETFQFVDKIISESGIKTNYETDEITTHNIDITLSPNIDDLKYQINDNELTESDKQLINNFINDIEKYNNDDLTGSVIVETASSSYFEPISGEHVNISEITTNVLIDIKVPENENIILSNNQLKNIGDSNEPPTNFSNKQINEQIQVRKISEEQKTETFEVKEESEPKTEEKLAFEPKTVVEPIEEKEDSASEPKIAVEPISEPKIEIELIEVKEDSASEPKTEVGQIKEKEESVSEPKIAVEPISEPKTEVGQIEVEEESVSEPKTEAELIEVKEDSASEPKTEVEPNEVKEDSASEPKTVVELIKEKEELVSEPKIAVEPISEPKTEAELIEVKEDSASEPKTVVKPIEEKEDSASEPKIAVEPISEPKIEIELIEVKEDSASEPKTVVELIKEKEESVSEPKTEVGPISEPKSAVETIEVNELTETIEKIKVESKLVSETIGDEKLTETVSEIVEEIRILDTAHEKTESVSADEIKASEIIEEKKTTELIEQLVSELKKEVEPSDLSLDNNETNLAENSELIKDLSEESVIISEIVTQIDNLKDTEIVVESNFKETVVEINTDDNNGFEMQIKTSDGNGNNTITTILAESANFSQSESSQIIVETQKVDETSNQDKKTENSISTVVLSGVLSDNQTEIDIETKSNVSIEEVLFEIEKKDENLNNLEKNTEKLAEQEVIKNS